MRRTRERPIGRLAIGVLLVAGAVGALVFQATGDNLTYYRTVDELLAAPAGSFDGMVRLSGDVAAGSIERDDATRTIRFAITSTTPAEAGDPPTMARRVPVEYSGPVPDIFRPGIQVVVEGRMGEDGTFLAETLLAKCPSKYQAAGELASPDQTPGS